MHKHKEEHQAHNCAERWGIGEAPGEGRYEEEEGEEVGERRIGTVPSVFGFWEGRVNIEMLSRGVNGSAGHDLRFYPMAISGHQQRWFRRLTYMVIYRFKDLLGCNQQRGHLPDCHLKVHLGELEKPRRGSVYRLFASGLPHVHEPLEEAWHAHAGPAAGRGAKIGRTGMLARNRDVRVHGRGLESRSFTQRGRCADSRRRVGVMSSPSRGPGIDMRICISILGFRLRCL